MRAAAGAEGVEFEADVAAALVARRAPRKVIAGFFELVGHQIHDVERIQQRGAQPVIRFTALQHHGAERSVAATSIRGAGAVNARQQSSSLNGRLTR